MKLKTGSRICGDYTIVSELGKGSYGNVYKVKDLNGEVLALKHFSTNTMHGLPADILVELDILSRIDHPNVVHAEYIHSDKTVKHCSVCLVLELADTDVRHVIKQGLDYNSKNMLMFQIACGLNYLHNNFIIHRDLKTDNVLIANGTAKITDFGLSIITPDKNVVQPIPKHTIGAYYFRAPEAWRHQPYSTKLDCWTLGLVFIEIIFGDIGVLFNKDALAELNNRFEMLLYDQLFNQDRIDTFIMTNIQNTLLQTVLVGLLQVDPYYRSSAYDVINSMYFQELGIECDMAYEEQQPPSYTITPYDSNNPLDLAREGIWEGIKQMNDREQLSLDVWFAAIDLYDRVISIKIPELMDLVKNKDNNFLYFQLKVYGYVCWRICCTMMSDLDISMTYLSKLLNINAEVLSGIECEVLQAVDYHIFRPNYGMIYISRAEKESMYELMLRNKSPNEFTTEQLAMARKQNGSYFNV